MGGRDGYGRRRRRGVMTTLALFALVHAAARAADAEPGSTVYDIEPVVVTATRAEIGVRESPASISVVSAPQIERRNAYRLGDVLAEVPGLYLRGSAFGTGFPASGATSISLRGIPRTTRTLVLVDGLPVNTALSGGIDLSGMQMEDVRRIEVVRGPYSALYGGYAMGGVINVVTKLPDKEELQARLGAGFGDMAPSSAAFAWRNRFDGGLGVSLAAGYRDSNGWRDSDYVVKTPAAGGDPVPAAGAIPTTTVDGKPAYWVGLKGARPWDQRNAALRLDQALSSATRVTAGAAYSLYHSRYAPPESFLRDAAGPPLFTGNVTIDENPARRVTLAEADFITPTPSSERDSRYFARLEHDFGNQVRLRAQAGYFDHQFRFAQPVAATSRYAGGAGEFVDQPNDRLDLDAQLRFPVADAWFVIVGAAANRNRLDRLTYAASYWREFATRGAIKYEGRGSSRTWALFAQSELAATDWMAIYAGGRVDWWDTEGAVLQNTAPAFDQAYARRADRQFSPKLAAVLTLHPTTTLRASWGTGFRPPTLLDLYSRTVMPGSVAGTVVVTDAAPDLKPERVRAAEIGIESRLATGTQISVAAFAQTLTDLIYRNRVSAALNQTANAGEAQVNGLEASVRQPLSGDRLSVFASATHLFRYEITRNAAIPASVGRVLTDVPRQIYSAGVEGERGAWSGSMVVRHVGHVYPSGDDLNANTAQGVYGSYDAHTVASAKLAYRFSPRVQLSVAVDNLLNAQYFALQKQPGLTGFAELTLRY